MRLATIGRLQAEDVGGKTGRRVEVVHLDAHIAQIAKYDAQASTSTTASRAQRRNRTASAD
jgi:hypothetical protein